MKTHRFIALALSVWICCSCTGAEKKEIRAAEIIRLIKKGKPVQMVNKIILGDLDFTLGSEPFILNANMLQCEIHSNIFFDHCIFMGKVTSGGKLGKTPIQGCFRNNLVFMGCDFRGEADFEGAVVFGTVNFGQSIFRENAGFNNMSVWARDSYFSEIKAEKDFSMIYASFAGNLYFLDAGFGGNVSFQETSAKGKLLFNNSVFHGRAGFDLMEVCGSAYFNYVRFEKTADFSRSRFLHTAEFVHTAFEKQASFEKTFFLNAVNFQGVDSTYLILTDAFFGNNK